MAYLVPAREARSELEVKRSRFIGVAHRAENAQQVGEELEALRRELPDATHYCYAYLLGDPASSSRMRTDDDGEPTGTAGKPILNVLKHKNVGDVLLVVVRYFGGIKLGAGGLVRAYGATASKTMEALSCIEAVLERDGRLTLDYADERPVRRVLEELGVRVIDIGYGERVELFLRLPDTLWTAVSKTLLERTSGRAKLIEI